MNNTKAHKVWKQRVEFMAITGSFLIGNLALFLLSTVPEMVSICVDE